MVNPEPPTPLGLLRIIDLSQGVSGAYCTKLLAGLGADVVKVEPPAGDAARLVPPFWKDEPNPETGSLFLHLNTGKRSVSLDVDQAGDVQTLRRLIAGADAVIESFPPGFMDEHGLGYDALRELNPSLVMTSITPFGQTGPYRDWKANELVSYALGGYAHLTGFPEQEPIKAHGYVVQYHAGLHASVATLAALWRRHEQDMGEYIDVSVHDAVAFIVDGMPERYRNFGVNSVRTGTRNVGSPRSAAVFSEVQRCADGYLHVHSPMGPAHHNGIADLLDEPRWLTPEFAAELPEDTDVIDGVLVPWLSDKTRDQAWRLAQKVNAPWTPVQTIPEILADPQLESRGYWLDLDHPVIGKVRHLAYNYRLNDTPWRTRRAPLLGEHTEEVLGSLDAPTESRSRRAPVVAGAGAAAPVRRRPLDGIRILDLSGGVVGPVGGGILADLGAELIRIEQPARVAAQRRIQAQARGGTNIGISAFGVHHHDKRHLSLDLRQPEGMDVLEQLIGVSDVLWENFSPRVMSNFGIECPTLQEINPRMIHVAMPAFGRSGPYRDFISMGPGVDAISGLSELTGYADGPPMKPGNFYADYMNGMLASHCILAGLFARDRTGRGQHIEATMLEAEVNAFGEAIVGYTLTDRAPTRRGNGHPTMAPHNVYPCHGDDRWVAIAVEDDDQWQALVRVMGTPAWAGEADFAGASGRHERQKEVDGRIAEWTREQDHREVMELLQAAGVPAGAVLHPEEMLEDPQLLHRGFYRDVPGTDLRTVSPGWQFAGTPMPVTAPPPEFGQDNDWVLRDLLGLSDEVIQSLLELRVIANDLDA